MSIITLSYILSVKIATNIVLTDRFFSVLIMLGWFPYGDIWADVELSSLWVFFVKHEIQNDCCGITEVIF